MLLSSLLRRVFGRLPELWAWRTRLTTTQAVAQPFASALIAMACLIDRSPLLQDADQSDFDSLPYSTADLTRAEYATDTFRMYCFKVWQIFSLGAPLGQQQQRQRHNLPDFGAKYTISSYR